MKKSTCKNKEEELTCRNCGNVLTKEEIEDFKDDNICSNCHYDEANDYEDSLMEGY